MRNVKLREVMSFSLIPRAYAGLIKGMLQNKGFGLGCLRPDASEERNPLAGFIPKLLGAEEAGVRR
jgi:hypothetical protein